MTGPPRVQLATLDPDDPARGLLAALEVEHDPRIIVALVRRILEEIAQSKDGHDGRRR